MMITDQQRIIEEVKLFANTEIAPLAASFDTNDKYSRELIYQMAQKGYLSANWPVEYGGLGLDPVHYGKFTEELGKVCCATRTLVTVHTTLVGETIVKWGTTVQKNKWLKAMASGEKIGAFALSEPSIGSDASKVTTRYIRRGNKFIVTGTKKWISFGDFADFFIVIATDNDSNVTAFLIERESKGVSTRPINGLMAGRGTHIAEIQLEEVEVAEENVLGKPGGGFAFIVSSALDSGRYSIAWAGVAMAQAALEAMIAYSRNRIQFGQKIGNYQLIQGLIADAYTKIQAGRALCVSAGEKRRDNQSDAIIETTVAKYFTSTAAMQVVVDAVQVHGANGISEDYPVERLFREAKVLEIIEGSSQIQQMMLADYALKTINK